jgi:succinyl-CoA synthetase beta subunit
MSFALLEKAGIPIPRYRVCETPEEVEKSAADLGLFLIIDMNY